MVVGFMLTFGAMLASAKVQKLGGERQVTDLESGTRPMMEQNTQSPIEAKAAKRRGFPGILLVVVLGGLAMMSIAIGGELFPALDAYPMLLVWGLLPGLGATLIFLPIAWKLSRDVPRKKFLVFTLLCVASLIALGEGGIRIVNAVFDPNPLVEQNVEVIRGSAARHSRRGF